MATRQDKDLQQMLRRSGVRKKLAKAVTDAAGTGTSGKQPKLLTHTAKNLRAAAAELEDRAGDPRRRNAAIKAAQTRKRKADKRSEAARKAAKTRAKHA